jgi:hypothetical protein
MHLTFGKYPPQAHLASHNNQKEERDAGSLCWHDGGAAMAVQNAVVQISINCAPATAVMTTNITRFMMDIGEISIGRGDESAASRKAHLVRYHRLCFGLRTWRPL